MSQYISYIYIYIYIYICNFSAASHTHTRTTREHRHAHTLTQALTLNQKKFSVPASNEKIQDSAAAITRTNHTAAQANVQHRSRMLAPFRTPSNGSYVIWFATHSGAGDRWPSDVANTSKSAKEGPAMMLSASRTGRPARTSVCRGEHGRVPRQGGDRQWPCCS